MPTVQLFDRLTLDKPRTTSEGYLAVRARAARSGIYDYRADEVGADPAKFAPTDTVKIYRDADEVFSEDAVRSFIGRPITDNHPKEAVTADNWRDHARGTIMGAMRDGDYLTFDLVLMDKAAISAVERGRNELSNGYQSNLDWTPGTHDGQRYDARQTSIRGNHVALVDAGRAGPHCAIKDGERFALCDANPAALADLAPEKTMKTMNFDGYPAPVNLGDEAAVEAVIKHFSTAARTATDSVKELEGKVSTLDGEKAALQTQLTAAQDAAKPEQLDKLVADRTALVDEAKKLVPTLDATGKSALEIKRVVVDTLMGDQAKDLDDGGVAGAFRVLCATGATQDQRPAVLPSIRAPQIVTDNRAVRDLARDMRHLN